MSFSINRVTMAGILTEDPVAVTTETSTVVRLILETTERWRDRHNGELRTRTERHRVAIYNQSLCELALKSARCGSKVYIEGAVQSRRVMGLDRSLDRQVVEIALNQHKSTFILVDEKPVAPAAPAEAAA